MPDSNPTCTYSLKLLTNTQMMRISSLNCIKNMEFRSFSFSVFTWMQNQNGIIRVKIPLSWITVKNWLSIIIFLNKWLISSIIARLLLINYAFHNQKKLKERIWKDSPDRYRRSLNKLKANYMISLLLSENSKTKKKNLSK
jgi:hypothetical protein